MDTNLLAVIGLMVVALSFDFINGFHDAANSIATVVSTRVLTPGRAVVWAAFFNFVAAFTFGTAVAKTVGAGLVDINVVTFAVIFAALIGAIAWDLITWYYGLPTSSSHALIGGYAGAAVAKAGFAAIILAGWTKTLVFIVLAPVIGLILAFGLMVAILWVFSPFSPGRVDHWFRRLQLVSAAAYSLGHGGNDAQKTMGIIAGALVAGNYLQLVDGKLTIPIWVILAAHAAIALGTLSGGWRIIHTMGSKITKLQPVGGFAAETAGALSLFGATYLGVPVSTTHTITGAIIGVGSIRRLSAVRWGIAGRIVWAWVLTIPAAAAIGAIVYWATAALVAP
ncbi:MAG: inorganic phosphate transporter [Acidobacteria bacterium RIFCSPLOWO2_02_FULL_67_36]|nr:MAG: inorganic phosphate transporter [Acidobacteria bacterium RIFCSPLOWO2_02_FULL_67_36]OFW23632.1 MAG: inorganic phosphate transporter [Acidobacteria bacterium RIFCSPLOWO2_12_FULL_66_21]